MATAQIPTDTDSAECASCGEPLSGLYCAACGQRVIAGPHTLRALVAGGFRRLFDLERGLTHTVVRLTVDPGRVVRDYLSGKTAVYVHPMMYLALAFAVFALVFRWTGGAGGDGDRVFWAAIVLFLTVASRVVFWRQGLNVAEHLILNFFLVGHAVLLFAAASVLLAWMPESILLWATVTVAVGAGAYVIRGYASVFDGRLRPVLGGFLVFALGLGSWATAMVILVRTVGGE